MNPSYVQTFNRHRLLFSLPVVIMTVLALWVVVATPKQYKAGTSLYVDNPAPAPSSLNNPNPAEITPSAQAQQLLNELLSTKAFRTKVGREGPLAKYLARHPGEGWGPTGLLGGLRGSASVDDRISKQLDAKHVMTVLPGGQVLSIELHGPTPAVAVGTLRTLVATFRNERRDLDVARQQGAMAHFKAQIGSAKQSIATANSEIASGKRSNPEVQGLVQARRLAETRLRRGTRGYTQALLNLQAAKAAKSSYKVIDKARLPAPAVSGMKKSVFGVVAGIFVGLLLSFLAIVLMTGSEDKRRERDELREVIARTDDVDVEAPRGTNGSDVSHVPRAKATGKR
jgi:hypothetical protein